MSRSTLRTTLVGAAATALVAAGFHALPAVASPTTEALPRSVATANQHDAAADGKDLFRSIFFLQGDATRALISEGALSPRPEAMKTSRSAEMIEAVDTVIDGIDAEHPGFFADFSANLRSGDPYAVEQALVGVADVVEEHFKVIDATNGGDGQGACLAVALAVVGFVVVLYSISRAVVLDKHVLAENTVIQSGGLDQEQAVAKLTLTLAR